MAGRDQLKHLVVLMRENRSFDHMLGALQTSNGQIDGIKNAGANPDSTNAPVLPQPLADYQGQLDPDPDHAFAAVDKQIFNEDLSEGRQPTMTGFVRSYFDQRRDIGHSHKIMYYFTPHRLDRVPGWLRRRRVLFVSRGTSAVVHQTKDRPERRVAECGGCQGLI